MYGESFDFGVLRTSSADEATDAVRWLVAADEEEDDLVYLKKVHADERWIAFRLGVLLQGAPPAPAALDQTGLAADQRQALIQATTHPVSLVTGSTGTGKTTMIKRIVESFPDACANARVNARVALAAAKRLFEQTGQRAVTLHKILEPQHVGARFVFTRNLNHPIEADLIVLDEVSMIDTALMARFLDAVADHTRLVLVGDPHQLPSVGPGNLLGDLIASGAIPTSELTQMGDAGTGKSQTTQRLAEFVDIGDTFSGLTGSRTGLSYALVEHQQKGWQVKIGRYPANSRKLLIVDEAQHLPDWDVRTLAKAMEEGFLQVDRVQSKGYESQTRLILIANPKKDRIMDTFAFGCEALKTLFPPMILRRIDLAVFANTSDLQDLSFASQPVTGDTPRQVTPEGLRAVIYWAWTLTPQQIRFAPAAERHCLQRAEALARVYGLAGDIPLVPPSDVRNKLARLAAAFAVFQGSASDDFSRLHIEPEHVDLAAKFLDTMYTHENCGLDQYSALKGRATQLRDYEQIAQAFLKKRADEERVNGSTAPSHFSQLIYALRATDAIRRDELVEQLDCGLDTVKRGVQLLKRFNLLDSTKDGYVKKPKFNRFLRRFLAAQPDFFDGLDREAPAPEVQVEGQVALSENAVEGQVGGQVDNSRNNNQLNAFSGGYLHPTETR